MPNEFEKRLRKLAHYVGEDILTEEAEDRIIEIEERWESSGKVRGTDVLWVHETVKRLEEEG